MFASLSASTALATYLDTPLKLCHQYHGQTYICMLTLCGHLRDCLLCVCVCAFESVCPYCTCVLLCLFHFLHSFLSMIRCRIVSSSSLFDPPWGRCLWTRNSSASAPTHVGCLWSRQTSPSTSQARPVCPIYNLLLPGSQHYYIRT